MRYVANKKEQAFNYSYYCLFYFMYFILKAKCLRDVILLDEVEYTSVCLFVCFEVLQSSQPNGVMSSAVSFTNHTFTGQV